MATQNVNIGVNVSDNGTAKKVVKSFQEIETAARAAQRAAQAVNPGGISGTAGSRMVAARAAPTGSQQMMDNQGYGSARGTAGLTGASGRDFANQAQGLGGLVRLYATYAANVFAVSAAFTALSNAMDTTNMIKGLDQLGAATGRNLGGLSKRLVEITDGAISFKDSMDAVAKTTSAGMASRDVERLAMVAKNASLALGVAMPDAMNRLSRGITKLEPELLDELGIFTKIDPAVQAYSRAVGKAASQLTDFERRQAFANAVLLEGEAKFGELATAAVNPYDTLLASLKNVTQQALEVVNKVLAPMVSLLASSPGALAGALAVLGTVLLRQAIPALTEFKAGLASAADTATELAKSKAEDAKAARARIDKDILAEVETRAAKEIDAVDRAERKIENLRKAGYAKNSTAAKLLAQDLDDIRKEDLAKQERIAKGLESKAKRMADDPTTDPQALRNAQKAAEANRLVVTTLTSAKAAQEEFFATEKRIIEQTETAAKGRSVYGLTIQASLASQDAATKKNIVSNAAYNASLIGITGAFRLMNAEIAKSGLILNGFQLGLLKAKAGVAMLIGVLGTLSAAVNGLLGAIGLLTVVVGVLDSVFSKGTKEMDAFNSVLTKVDDAAANAARTLAHLDKRGGYASGTIEGISAMANAFVELASSAKEAVDSATLALAKMSTWDKIKDTIFGFFGGGVAKNLAKALTKDVTSALDLLTKAGLDKEAREKFKAILGVDSLDTDSVNQAILKLSDSAKNNLVTALSEANVVLNNSQSRLQSFKSATEGTTKAYQDFIVSTANTNPIFRIGSNLENLAKTMESVATGGVKEMEAAMISLAESPQQGLLFGGEFSRQLVGLRKGFLDQKAAVTAYENQLKELDRQIEVTAARMGTLQEGTTARTLAGQDLAQLKKDRDFLSKEINLLPRDKIEEARNIFNKGIDNAFKEGSRLIAVGLGQAAEKAALTIAKANLGGLTGERLAREQMDINKKDIDIQIRAIDTNIGLILSQERLRASIDESNAAANLAQAKSDKRPQEVIERLESALVASQGFKRIIGEAGTPNLSDNNLAAQAGIEGNQDAIRILKNQILTLRSQLGPQLAARREQTGARQAADITGQRAVRQGALQDLQKTQNLEQAIRKEQATRLGILDSIAGVSSKQSLIEQNVLATSQLTTRQLQEQQSIDVAIANAANTAQGEEEKRVLRALRLTTIQRQEEEFRNQLLQNRQKSLQFEIEQIGRRIELERSGIELQNTITATALETRSQEFALYSSAYDMSKQIIISQQASLEIQKAQVETSVAVAQAEASLAQKREEAKARLALLGEGEDVAAKALNDELARQTTITNNTIAGLVAQGAAKVSILQKTREINLEQERYNHLLSLSEGIASSLSEAFGQLGASLGGVTKAFTEIAISSERRAKAEELAVNARINAQATGNEEDILSTQKALEATRKKNAREALADDIKLVNSSKKLFKEKTGAYKILNAVEKTMHITKLAMDAKELAVKISTTTTGLAVKAGAETTETGMTFAGTLKRLPAYAAEIYGKTIGQLGPIAGPAVATALVAAMFAMFGKSSGGGSFTPTAEQRQETQGTAMGWNEQGQKVQVRRGVFGDTDAKSASIANSLKLIRENSVDGLSYDNRMLKALESIDRGINNAAKGLFSIQGLRTGSMFGTVQGSQSGGGLLGTGVFGSKTSRNITDSGLLIEGTFAQLASDTNKAVIDFFEQVTMSKRSWYGKTKTWVETQRKEIDDATSEFFQDIFGNATKLFVEVGAKAGISQQAVSEILGGLDVGKQFASLRGLKGEEFQKELSAVIGTILDDAGSAIFPQFEKFAQFGEGMLETVIRVVDSNEKALQSLSNIGVKLSDTSFDTTETLAELAGGIENFLDQNKFFAENFLTEAERLAPVQKAVTDELTKLGFATVDTREEFKQLVQSLDLTTDSGRDNFKALMNVAEGFDQVATAAEEAADKLKSTQQSLLDQVLELTGTADEILAASRARTLSETPEELRALQNYVFALEDVKTAESNLTKAREAEVTRLKQQKSTTEATVNSIKNYISSLQKFRQSLLLGADSPLTPAERYTESKRQFDAILATAMGTATTPEEQRTKDQALSQLEGASSSFLEASKVYNASSAQYMNDFNLVQRALLDTEGSLALQLSVEEKSLVELESQTKLLEDQITATNNVSNSILTLADAIAQLDTAKAGLATASASVGTQLMGAGGGSIIGNQMYGLKGNTGVVEGAGGGREGTTNFMRMVERGEQTAAELRRIYVEDWGYDSKIMAHIAGMTQQQVLDWFKRMDPSLPTFAKGTNYVPEDMLAQIHQGERIVPAADNAELMQSIGNRNRTNEVLVSEIKKLNQKIESLERVVAEGAVINAEATNRNTVEISRTVKDTGSTASHSEAIRRRTQIV